MQSHRPWASRLKRVFGVEDYAGSHGEATAADATGEFVFEFLDRVSAFLELFLPVAGESLPVVVAGGVVYREGGEHL